jgi:3-hydroxy-5-methyl-1-naphthoate 3-O-methyltransferase
MTDLTLAPQSDPIRVYRYRDGLYGGDLVTAALVHLDFFTWLGAHPSTKEEICAHFQFAERPTDVMLTLFAANGFITRIGGRFEVTQVAREHLSTGSTWNLAPYYASLKNRPITLDFLEVLKTDKPAGWGGTQKLDWHQAMETEEFSRSFTAAMDCRGHYLSQALAKKVDLSGRKRLLDIGGGSGIYACSFAAHFPHLRGVVFEQHPVSRITERCIQERGLSDCVEVITGDVFKDALPANCDVHLLSNVLHDWGVNEVHTLLKISHDALPADGMLIIHDAFINEDKTGPLPVAEYSAMLMHATQGKCYSVGEYAALLKEVGFVPGKYQDTAADRGFMTASKQPETHFGGTG